MKTHRFCHPSLATAATAILLAAAPAGAQTLFVDTFNRPNNASLNASSVGQSGILAPLTWSSGSFQSTIDILGNSLRINNDDTDGNDGSWAWPDHNFVDTEIKTEGTFKVSMKITEQTSGGNGRLAGFRIGQSLADISGETDAATAGNAADVAVYLDTVGTLRGIKVFHGSTDLGYVTPNVTTLAPGELSATFTFTDMNAGTTLNYEVFLDGALQYTGATTWSGTDENYISLQSNSTENTLIDSFLVQVPGTDVTGPGLITTSPVDDAPAVPIASNLVATFDEPIALGATGSVTIRNLTNPADVVIDVAGGDPDGTVTVSSFDLTINPAVNLVPGNQYVIEISSSAVKDLSGNTYAGLLATDTPNWSFTADGTPPQLTITNPADNATNVLTTSNLVASFNEPIALGTTGSVTIINLTNPGSVVIELPGPDPDGTLAVTGTQLTINPAANLVAGDEYVIEIAAGTVVDASGNPFGGLLQTDTPNWSFTTDNTAPSTIGFGPMVDADDVDIRELLTLTFNEGVALGSGNITIHLVGDNSVVETIDVTGGLVTINGTTVSIDPSVELAYSTAYYINIEAGAFLDISGNAYQGILDTTTWTFTTVAFDPNLLFADNFNRPNSANLNASSGGKSGIFALSNYSTRGVGPGALVDINTNALRMDNGTNDAGENGAVAWVDQNFTGLTSLTVSLTFRSSSSIGNGRNPGFGIGQTIEDLMTMSGAAAPNSLADVYIARDNFGTTGIEIWHNGVSQGITAPAGGFNPNDVLSATFTFADMNAGTPLNYEVFLNGNSVRSGSTTWSGTNENYISIQSNTTGNTLFDSFEVRGETVVTEPLALAISLNGGLLDFSWNSIPGMQYDLLSSTDLSVNPSLWAPYNDGVNIYENLMGNSLTGVGLDGPRRFFVLVEEPVPPIGSWDFEADNGGFTPTGTPNDWAWGSPDSNNGVDLTITEGNAGSTNCWATNLGSGGGSSGFIDNSADSILRSPDIDLSSVAGAELSFAAAIDALSGDVVEIRVRDADTDAILDTILPFTLPLTADWTDYGPFALAGAGETIYLEFRYKGASNSYIGLYLDDVLVTPTAP